MLEFSNPILVVDVESTCWINSIAPAGQQSEIIEIGVCLLDTKTGEISQSKGILIKPQISEVSPFCTELTTITKELLDNEGISFSEACTILRNEYQSETLTWASYGDYDKKMFVQECELKNVPYPYSQHHVNAKAFFIDHLKLKKRPGMSKALDILKIPLEGVHHRGVDDAKNIAKILNWTLAQKKA